MLGLLGDRDEKIQGERAELVRHKLQRDEARAAVEPLESERERLRARLGELTEADEVHAELLTAKEAVLRGQGGEVAERLVTSAEALGELEDEGREIDEACAAGRDVVLELDAALESLGSERNWGTFDMVGGGMFVKAIERAQETRRAVRQILRRLEQRSGRVTEELEAARTERQRWLEGLG